MSPKTNGGAWSSNEDHILCCAWPRGSPESLAMALPGRTYIACKMRARNLGVRRIHESPQGSLAPLLDESPIAAYWMGFIAADGSVGQYRLTIKIHTRDEAHLRSLAGWLGPDFFVKHQQAGRVIGLSCQDRLGVSAIRNKFDLRPRKTYDPPRHLPYSDPVLLRCFLCGMIDGDGTIRHQSGRRSALLVLTGHRSWLPFLSELSVATGFGKPGTRVGGVGSKGVYACLCSHRHNELKELKAFSCKVHLPVLQRKWANIDMTYHARGDQVAEVRSLMALGVPRKEILDKTGAWSSVISKEIRRTKNNAALSARKGSPT